MKRNIEHSLLDNAKISKKDEFYTQLCDIESELQYYEEHFKNKIVYCNCDDPRKSNFYKYFANNFRRLGLKKIICSCYNKDINTLFAKKDEKAFYYEYINEEKIFYFNGNGDFRNQENIKLLKESDIIVTNPPFSLFRDFIDQLEKYQKKYLIIANVNALTYKNVFSLIQNNKCWLGINLGRGISGFIVPENYDLYGTEVKIDAFGNRIISTNNCLWLTNLDNKIRHENIPLTHKYHGNEIEYPKYDNYDAINVDKTSNIPFDYTGTMGVPITFLHKFNPSQFEIIKFRKGNNDKDLQINGKCPYFRILIKRIIKNE